jgi:hypothetical protein
MIKHADDFCRRLWVKDIVGTDGSLPPRLARLERVAGRHSHLKIRQVRLGDWDNEVHLARELYDATIGRLPDHIPSDEDEIAAFAEELRPSSIPVLSFSERSMARRKAVCWLSPPLTRFSCTSTDGRVLAQAPRLVAHAAHWRAESESRGCAA